MVQTRRGTHASPTPQQQTSPEAEDHETGPAPQQRQTRNTIKASSSNDNSKRRRQVPQTMLELLEDEPSSSRPNKRQRRQQDDQDDDDSVEVNFDLINNGIRSGIAAPEAGASDAQLQRENSERPQTAEEENEVEETSDRRQPAEPRPRTQKSRRTQKRVPRPPVILSAIDEDVEDVPSEQNQPPPASPLRELQEHQAPIEDADEDGDIPPLEEALERSSPAVEDDLAAEIMYSDGEEYPTELDFPKLPEHGQKEQIVGIKVGALADMLKLMGAVGFTGHGRHWMAEIKEEINPNFDTVLSPKTDLCQKFWQATNKLARILDRTSTQPTPLDQEEYFREKTDEIKWYYENITKYINGICNKKLEKLGVDEPLPEKNLKKRHDLVGDMLRYGIPGLVNVLGATFKLGGVDELTRKRVTGHFTSITLELLIQGTRWMLQLFAVIKRELQERPFEPESARPQDRLRPSDIETRDRKAKNRAALYKKLRDFRAALAKAIKDLLQTKIQEDNMRQQAEKQLQRAEMARNAEREARIREEQENARRKEHYFTQWNAYVVSSQNLRTRPDPVTQKWHQAMKEGEEFQRSSQASQQWVASTQALRDVPDPVEARWTWGRQRSTHPLVGAEEDPVGDETDQEQGQDEPGQVDVPVWPEWRADEDDVVRVELKYSRTLNVPRIAKKLNRDEHDVKQHINDLVGGRAVPGL